MTDETKSETDRIARSWEARLHMHTNENPVALPTNEELEKILVDALNRTTLGDRWTASVEIISE